MTDDECAACRDLWSWSDGSAVSWHSWRDSEPNGIFDCGALTLDDWIAQDCDLEMRFLCEKGMFIALETFGTCQINILNYKRDVCYIRIDCYLP